MMKKCIIIIVMALGLIMLMSIILTSTSAPKGDARKARSRQEMSFLKSGLFLYVQEYGDLPQSSLNADILEALSGKNPRKLSFYSAPTHLIQNGQLLDGWERPYAFRNTSGNMLIRSAGKDGILYTKDDLTLEVLMAQPEKAK